MTIRDALQSISIDRLDAELLLAFVLRVDRSHVKAHPDQAVSKRNVKQFFRLVAKREAHVPLAYILGYKQFFGYTFFVTKHTLVPRPDTELLVAMVIDDINTHDHDTITLIDVGTGTGCIPIACSKAISTKKLHVYATDISKKALNVASRNAKKHDVDITFKHGNLLQPVMNHCNIEAYHQVLITANLPYITEDQWQSEPSIQKEPKSALVANEAGLALYRELLEQLHSFVTHPSIHITLYIEIDPSQTEAIQKLIHSYVEGSRVSIHQDLGGADRIIRVDISANK